MSSSFWGLFGFVLHLDCQHAVLLRFLVAHNFFEEWTTIYLIILKHFHF